MINKIQYGDNIIFDSKYGVVDKFGFTIVNKNTGLTLTGNITTLNSTYRNINEDTLINVYNIRSDGMENSMLNITFKQLIDELFKHSTDNNKNVCLTINDSNGIMHIIRIINAEIKV
jgi:hypothetical protein